MPDSQCSVTAAKPCCGDELGTFEPRLGKPAFVDVTYHTRLALGDKGGRLLAVELYPGLGANSKEDYFVQYGSSRRGDRFGGGQSRRPNPRGALCGVPALPPDGRRP